MSDSPPLTADDEPVDLAGEYVLGLIEGESRVAANARLRADPGFRADVEAWELRLAPLFDQVSPAPAPPGVWDRVAAAIAPGANVVVMSPRTRLWNRVGPWRLATAASVAALIASLILRPSFQQPSPHPVLAATIATPQGEALFVATLDRAGVAVVPVNSFKPGGRYPELWIIRGGAAPSPVGMLQTARPVSVRINRADAKDVLAVSLEPEGGSPTGAPTGPVIATGALRSL